MLEKDEKDLFNEVEHIFESGANSFRVFEMVKSFINSRSLQRPESIVEQINKQYNEEHIRYQIIDKRTSLVWSYKLYKTKEEAQIDCLDSNFIVSMLFLV